MAQHNFRFNLPGLLTMLGTNIYSEPQVCVREMIQNSHDSCTRRQIEDPSFRNPQINVSYDRSRRLLRIMDNGSGLTEQEIHNYLATIGSGKTAELRRALEQQNRREAEQLIGQFGLGLLSAFAVGERVEIVTRSHGGDGPGLHWRCEGGVNYTLDEVDEDRVGTRVDIFVQPRHAALLNDEELRRAIKKYADLLRVPIYLGASRAPVNTMRAPWHHDATGAEYADFVAQHFSIPALEVIPVHVEDDVTVHGVLYVPKSSLLSVGEHGDLEIYVRGIFIKDGDRKLLPRWAKFVRGMVDSPSLTPTVSRDEIVHDDTYERVHQLLGAAVLSHLDDLSRTDGRQLRAVVQAHNTLIKAWAIESDEFFDHVAPLVQFETDVGRMSLPAYLERVPDGRTIFYFKEAGSGTQQRILFGAKDVAVIDASSGVEEAFLQKFAARNPGYSARRLDADAELIFEPAPREARWTSLVDEYYLRLQIEAQVVAFDPPHLPAVLVAKRSEDRLAQLDAVLESAAVSDELRRLFGALKDERERSEARTITKGSMLNLNTRNPVIQVLADLEPGSDVVVLAMGVLYNNAVLFSQHAITAENAVTMCITNNRAVQLMIEQARELAKIQAQGASVQAPQRERE